MSALTPKQVPYPTGTDAAASLDTLIQSLAEWVDTNPGIAAMTTTARNALPAAGKWVGRIIYNTSTSALEQYTGSAWQSVVLIGPSQLLANAVTTPAIADGAVTTPKIPDGAILSAKMAAGAVNTTQLADSGVTTPKIEVFIANPIGGARIIGLGKFRIVYGQGYPSPSVPAAQAPTSNATGWASNGYSTITTAGAITFQNGGSPAFIIMYQVA